MGHKAAHLERSTECLVQDVLGVLAELEKKGELPLVDQVSSLLFLDQVADEDPALVRSITRKIARQHKRFPEEIKRVLPMPRKGFRRKSNRGRIASKVKRSR